MCLYLNVAKWKSGFITTHFSSMSLGQLPSMLMDAIACGCSWTSVISPGSRWACSRGLWVKKCGPAIMQLFNILIIRPCQSKEGVGQERLSPHVVLTLL